MFEDKFATYNIVEAPKIESSFFNKKTSDILFGDNPISSFFNDYIYNTKKKEDNKDNNENIEESSNVTISYSPIDRARLITKTEQDDSKKTPELKVIKTSSKNIDGRKLFEEYLTQAEQINPEVRLYRTFLIMTADAESSFRSNPKNRTGAPYYGYFGMGEDPIKRMTGLSIELFKNDPVQLILGAVKLYKANLKKVKELGIYEMCKNAGYSDDAIIAGTWLGGPGGVLIFISGKGDPSDSHWYKAKGLNGGTSVGKRMKEFNI